MNIPNRGSNAPQSNQPHSDRKVKLLLALLVVLGATLVFLSTPFSEKTLGIKLSSLFSSASRLDQSGLGTGPLSDSSGGSGPSAGSSSSGGGVFNCIAAPCLNPNLSILNPTPSATWQVGSAVKISWDGVQGNTVDITLEPSTCSSASGATDCPPAIKIASGIKNEGTFTWQVPPNISPAFLNGLSRLIVTIDNNNYNQTQVQIVTNGETHGDGDQYPDGTYIYFNDNPTLVYKIEHGTKRPLAYPAQEVISCLGDNPALIKVGGYLETRLTFGPILYCNPTALTTSQIGTLITGMPNMGNGAVYLVTKTGKRPFPNGKVFECLGYSYADIHIGNSKDVTSPVEASMTCNDTTGSITISGDGTFPTGKVNVPYSAQVSATGGVLPYTWEVRSVVPAANVTVGASIGQDKSTQVQGLFTSVGTYQITLKVSDSQGHSAAKTYSLLITADGSGGGGTTDQSCVENATQTLTALYRFYSSRDSDHYFSTSPAVPAGYQGEGITAYIYTTQVPGTVPLYQSYSSERKDHYYGTDLAGVQTFGYHLDGKIGYIYPTQVVGSNAMYRMYNASAQHYLMTTSTVERDAIVDLGFAYQSNVGYTCGTPRPGSEQIAIYRLWSKKITDHFYTTSTDERDDAMRHGYVSEGIAGYMYSVPGPDRLPVYRSWNSRLSSHFYTTSNVEAGSAGFTREGIIGFISNSPSSSLTQLYRLYNSKISDHFYTTSTDERDGAVRGGYKFEGTMGYLP